MPVSVVVGGQFGSEGKGKVALEIVRRDRSVAAVVRVGGTNSGHTAVAGGITYVLRQLPAASVGRSCRIILPAGTYIDLEVLQRELALLGRGPESVAISPMARIITDEHKKWEQASGLGPAIGSTQSGTGAAVIALTAREASNFPLHSVHAEDISYLQPFLRDTTEEMRLLLDTGKRVVIEGTQGFGLSLLHSGVWPKATSRDTSAAGFVAEAGLSPRDVDDVTMVIRSYPIRVAGESGPLPGQTTWEQIAADAGWAEDLREFTTVTKKLRRVGKFDAQIVRRAIQVNRPNRIVLNHLDYVDAGVRDAALTFKARQFVERAEAEIGQQIDWLGTGPATTLDRRGAMIRT